jgi:hypothetical protein
MPAQADGPTETGRPPVLANTELPEHKYGHPLTDVGGAGGDGEERAADAARPTIAKMDQPPDSTRGQRVPLLPPPANGSGPRRAHG